MSDVPQHVQQAHDHARDELRKADTKVTTLLSLVGAALAGVVALTTRQVSVSATVALWTAATPIFASVLVLLSALRPRLSEPTPGTWLDAALNGPSTLLDAPDAGSAVRVATDAAQIGRTAVCKYRRISRAVVLLVIGLSLLAVALVLAVA
ncbi:hypothetical protein SAMN05421837_10542 [Amycolatopsis pretoriensis]|uniref:Pycsar effector protein domain-containing protein n=1 Tax=Amycolatopsis pretoriensis TaxID=218821 RepID=A0A1H5QVK2_9PSEU|nr:Pycsar system effector family protein [Amycolatopsis pretoriensis]SEF30176.1 hypothetical protein SAMN05421837_10542 [Amycolatopsis pretoriensis]